MGSCCRHFRKECTWGIELDSIGKSDFFVKSLLGQFVTWFIVDELLKIMMIPLTRHLADFRESDFLAPK